MTEILFQTDNAQLKVSMWVPKRVVMTQDAVYLFDFGISPFISVISMQFGLIGALIANRIIAGKKKKTLETFEGKNPEEIMMLSPKHIKILLSEITEYQVKDGGLRHLGNRGIVFTAQNKKHDVNFDKMSFEEIKRQLEQMLPPHKKK